MSFATNLKIFMNLKEVSPTSLAEMLKVSLQEVQQWCAGKTRPDQKCIKEIADIFGTTPFVLLYGYDYSDSEDLSLYPHGNCR